MKNILVMGLGEVGKAIKRVEEEAGNKVYVSEIDFKHDFRGLFDLIHICIPFTKSLKFDVLKCAREHPGSLVMIHSTVAVGTTSEIQKELGLNPVVHSPVRGIHPNLYDGLKTFVKYVGGEERSCDLAIEHLESIGIEPYYIGDSNTSELLKILSTTYYGLNIAFANYVKELCDKFGMDYDKVYKNPNLTYNLGYGLLGKDNVKRPVLNPPQKEGIGGHCISSNATLLYDLFPSGIIKEILKVGYDNKDKFNDKTWLYCEHIGKEKTPQQIAEENETDLKTILEKLKKFEIPIKDFDS